MTILYLHGFASSPGSRKAVAFAARFAALGHDVDRLELRRPSLAALRLSAILDEVARAAAAAPAPVVLIGSSLGGLAAARHTERDPRVVAQVLLAPAFQLVPRWRERLGPAAWQAWRDDGALEVHDYATGAPARVHAGFLDDAAAIDPEGTFPAFPVPTLILHGVGDDVVPIATSRQVAAAEPRVRLIELDDDHELGASIPRLLAEAEAFLAPWLDL
ncbi:MAG: YqiA/YcfP family alpha/beta fold hydrolase [Kofleriaceae bacterium]